MNTERDYGKMNMQEFVDVIIADCKKQGTVTMPLRLDGYHTCANVQYSSFAK